MIEHTIQAKIRFVVFTKSESKYHIIEAESSFVALNKANKLFKDFAFIMPYGELLGVCSDWLIRWLKTPEEILRIENAVNSYNQRIFPTNIPKNALIAAIPDALSGCYQDQIEEMGQEKKNRLRLIVPQILATALFKRELIEHAAYLVLNKQEDLSQIAFSDLKLSSYCDDLAIVIQKNITSKRAIAVLEINRKHPKWTIYYDTYKKKEYENITDLLKDFVSPNTIEYV